MHWQFTDTDSGEVWYCRPTELTIKLTDCVLHNNKKLAEKIYLGKNKDVCAWIKCKHYEVLTPDSNIEKTYTHCLTLSRMKFLDQN